MRTDLNLGQNMLGPLSGEVRARLVALLEDPSYENWDNCYTIILRWDGLENTLWQGVTAVDPTFPRTGPITNTEGRVLQGWKAIPNRETIEQAIAYLTH